MNRASLLLRTFGWAAVGFLVTNGALLALSDAIDAGDYSTGVTALALSGIAAVLAGVLAALNVLRFGESPLERAANQGVQMLIAGFGVLGITELTSEAVGNFGTALVKLVIASAIGALQAYLVNRASEPAPV
jgi:hypothetical protein